MEDILSQGGDREPGPGPRRLAVIVALVALVAGGGVYLGVSRHQPATAIRVSVSSGRCAPCCSSEPTGTTSSRRGPASTSGQRAAARVSPPARGPAGDWSGSRPC